MVNISSAHAGIIFLKSKGSRNERILWFIDSLRCLPVWRGSLLPTFADKMKVDDAELAKANASVTGVFVKDQTTDIEKDVRDQERLQASGNYDKGAGVSPSVSKESETVYQNISGQTTSNSGFRGMNMSITGGINAVNPH
jgi:hypothetical protein